MDVNEIKSSYEQFENHEMKVTDDQLDDITGGSKTYNEALRKIFDDKKLNDAKKLHKYGSIK